MELSTLSSYEELHKACFTLVRLVLLFTFIWLLNVNNYDQAIKFMGTFNTFCSRAATDNFVQFYVYYLFIT